MEQRPETGISSSYACVGAVPRKNSIRAPLAPVDSHDPSGCDWAVTERHREDVARRMPGREGRNVLDDGDELADHATAQEQESKVYCSAWRTERPATRAIRVRCRSSSRRGVSTSPTSKTWCGPGSRLQ